MMPRLRLPLVFAFALLIPLAAETSLEDLVRALGSEDWPVREDATIRLIDAGDAAKPLLAKALGDKDAEVRMRAREAIEAIDAGMTGELYREHGNVTRGYEDLPLEERRALLERLVAILKDRGSAIPIARLVRREPDEAHRRVLAERALGAHPDTGTKELLRLIDEKMDPVIVVVLAQQFNGQNQAVRAVEILKRLPPETVLSVEIGGIVARMHGEARRWKEAADAYRILADKVPQESEAIAAGERIAWLHLAGEKAEAQAAVDLSLRADDSTRVQALTISMDILERERLTQASLAVGAAAMEKDPTGAMAVRLGRLLLAQGREGEALLCFRSSVRQAKDDASRELALSQMHSAYLQAGESSLATPQLAKELADPVAAAARHAKAARALSEAGFPGAAAVEWKKVVILQPGLPGPASEAARALRSCGDHGTERWAQMARVSGADGWLEEKLMTGSVSGRELRPVLRRACSAVIEGGSTFYAACGDIGVTARNQGTEVVAFTPSGRNAWTWSWSERIRQWGDPIVHTRNYEIQALYALHDGFLVALTERDKVISGFSESRDQWGGEWLVVIDAATGLTRSMARSATHRVNATDPAIVAGPLVVTSDLDVTCLGAIEIATGRTAWVRPVDRFTTKTADPTVAHVPRFALHGDLIIVPSPHGSRIRAFHVADGSPAWSTETPGGAWDLSLAAGRVYAAAGNSAVCLDAATGRLLWTAATGGPVRTAPVLAGSVVAVRSRDGTLRGLDPATGATRWSSWAGRAMPDEILVSAPPALFLLRRFAQSWAFTHAGRPVRRFHVDFEGRPSAWRGALFIDDTFGRRLPLYGPAAHTLEQHYPYGLLLIDPDLLLHSDARALADLAATLPKDVACDVLDIALSTSCDPEDPAALLARARATAEPDKARALDDCWRALDAAPPLDPLWTDIASEIERLQGNALACDIRQELEDSERDREISDLRAIARLRRKADVEAALWLGESGLAAAVQFLGEREGEAKFNRAAAIARLRLGRGEDLAAAVDEADTDANGMREEALVALAGRVEPEARAALERGLSESYAVKARLVAALALGGSKKEEALAVLEAYGLPSDDRTVFLKSAELLLAAERPRAVEALVRDNRPRYAPEGTKSPFEQLATSRMALAIEHFRAIATDPKNPHVEDALWELRTHDPKRMHEVARELLEEGTGDSTLDSRIVIMLSPGEHPEVAAAAAKVIPKFLGEPGDVGNLPLRLVYVDALDMIGDGATARRELDFYSSLFPDSASFCNNAAWYYSITRRPEIRDGARAVQLALQAVEAAPESSSYWDTLGEAFRENGQYRLAVIAALRAWELAPADGDSCDVPYCLKQLEKMVKLRAARGPGR